MKRLNKALILLAMLIMLFACRNPLHNTPEIPNQEKGTLFINFTMTDGTRTLLPDFDMDPASYVITGSGPGGSSFEVSTEETSVEIPGLAFGQWTVVVDAKNADEVIIGRGDGTVTVHVGQTQNPDIVVTPLTGYGTLDLTLSWNAGDTENPSIESELIPSAGSSIELDFTITGVDTGTYSSDTIPTGYHTLVLQLLDSGILTMGAVEVVRIVKDQTTTGLFEFYEINQPGGSIVVNITPEMADPIEVTMSGQVDEISEDGSMTVTASVPPDVGNVVYVWYINGESQATGESYTVSGLSEGVYRLDVTAFTVDGKRAGSASHMFHVVEGTTTPTAGEERTEITGSVSFDLRYTPAGTFVMGEDVQSPTPVVILTGGYWTAETETTYELWYEVYIWAVSNGYTFANQGREGHDGTIGAAPTADKTEPVTTINWRDAMIWCNALSEKQGLTPVYYTDSDQSTVIRIVNNTNLINSAYGDIAPDCVKWAANGYRLPTEAEWEYASRYRDGSEWRTPGNYASGATADYNDAGATGLVAWYSANSGSSTHPVGQKNANALGVNDMSGNVWEWCWDWYTAYGGGPLTDPYGPVTGGLRLVRGGSWLDNASDLQCAFRDSYGPFIWYHLIGFRPVRDE